MDNVFIGLFLVGVAVVGYGLYKLREYYDE